MLPHKTGEKNVVSDLVISAHKYPKSVTQEKKKFQEIHNTVFQNCVVFTAFWRCVSHVYGHKKKTFNQYKNCSLDKTGEGNMVSDLAISPQKYPKSGMQEKEKCQGICYTVF